MESCNALVSTSILLMGPGSSIEVPSRRREPTGYRDKVQMRESPSQDLRAYVALDASNEKLIGVRFGVLNEVNGCLLCGDSDEGVAMRG